jgi:HicB family
MDLSPYLESLRRDLAASAGPGGPEITRAADLLAGSLEASARLCLLEALSDAAAEVTSKLGAASVEVRLRGREADLVVTELTHGDLEPPPAVPPPAADGGADVARISLRLPESLKEAVERAAAAEGISVNAWLTRAISAAVHTGPPPPRPPRPPGRPSVGRRVTGFAQA